MKIGFMLGKWSSAFHGAFDITNLFAGKGLTGTESDFFNMARELALRGHDVEVYCDALPIHQGHADRLGGAVVRSIEGEIGQDRDAYLSWNEPDMLRRVPASALKIFKQEINDFSYSRPNWEEIPDIFVFLSQIQMEFLLRLAPRIPRRKCLVGYNSTNIEFFNRGDIERNKKRIMWCSSPDRGLHHILDIFPEVRAQVPEASLHVFYEFDAWYKRIAAEPHIWDSQPLGKRAHRLKASFDALGRNGENGIHLRGNVSNHQIAEELRKSACLAYTCDPVDFTEGFSIATLDACAAGTVPIIADVDALGQLYRNVAVIIEGKPDDSSSRKRWISEIVLALTNQEHVDKITTKARSFAQEFDAPKMAAAWEKLLVSALADRNHLPEVFEQRTASIHVPRKPMRIAMLYGEFSTQLHGKFDIPGLYETRGLTGSESYFFNTARGLSELGHQIDAFCDVTHEGPYWATEELSGAHVYPLSTPPGLDYDAYLSWNEPDLLRTMPATSDKLRMCVQQLNDFGYCLPDFESHVDLISFPSETHRQYMLKACNLDPNKTTVIPNSINPEFFEYDLTRSRSVVWCSSPDRGLHVLLELWPEIRARVPDAILKIFYRFGPWYDHVKDDPAPYGQRARYIKECLDRLSAYGDNGVILVGSIGNREMAKQLLRSRVLAYTCETLRFTEGFSVSIMDACAAGCVPIISDVDAIGEVYKDAATIIPGKPSDNKSAWIDKICQMLVDDSAAAHARHTAVSHAQRFTRQKVSQKFEIAIRERLAAKMVA
jgi:glycosyltransferase involved in cell wall biosynthesis